MDNQLNYGDALFKGIFDTALEAIITINEEGIIETFNPAAENLFGYKQDEVIGKNVTILMPAPYHTEHDQYLYDYKTTRHRKIIGLGREVRGKRKDESVFSMHLSVNEAEVDGRRVFIGFTRDISAEKALEKDLKSSENRAKAVLDTALDVIITIDRHGIIQTANQAVRKLFLYNPEELIGKPITILMPQPFAEEHDNYLKNYLETGQKKVIGIGREVIALRKSGTTFPIFLSVSEFELSGDRMFTGIIHDITEQKRIEEYLRDQKFKLESVNKELEGFSYSISHDLRAPLRHIIGYIQLLSNQIEKLPENESSEYKEHLMIIGSEATRMGELIDGLLEFSRSGRVTLSKNEVSFNEIIKQSIEELVDKEMMNNIKWHIEDMPKLSVDTNMLSLVWSNLISNALKFTRHKEKVIIEITHNETAKEHTFCIKDNGAGFNQEYVGKIFGVFQRLHSTSEYEGTGIGLSNVERIVLRHGGKVWAEGEENIGAKIYFSLPNNNINTGRDNE